jgi:hypothetical protein
MTEKKGKEEVPKIGLCFNSFEREEKSFCRMGTDISVNLLNK